MTPLYGHTDSETAFVVDDYPYGFRLRTQIRYWLEHKPGKGWRFISQTRNPKNGQWNKPKASTYQEIAGAMYVKDEGDEAGYVKWTGVHVYTSAGAALEFAREFPKADLRDLRAWAKAKVKFYSKLASGEASYVITVNGTQRVVSPAEATGNQARAAEERDAWQKVLDAVE